MESTEDQTFLVAPIHPSIHPSSHSYTHTTHVTHKVIVSHHMWCQAKLILWPSLQESIMFRAGTRFVLCSTLTDWSIFTYLALNSMKLKNRNICIWKKKGLNSLQKEPETSDKLKEKVELWLSTVRGFGALLWWQGGFCWYGLVINVKLFWLITFILW